MKTIKQWLKELPEPYRTQALENCDPKMINRKCVNIGKALLQAFAWYLSKQGDDYWIELYLKIEKNNLLNKE